MRKYISSMLFIILCIALTACNPNSGAQPNGYPNNQRQDQAYPYDPYGAYDVSPYDNGYGNDQRFPNDNNGLRNNVSDSNDGRITDEDRNDVDRTKSQEVADRLVQLATSVDQVNDATAVVLGRYAVVGIDVDAKLDRSKVGTIKYSVAEALKADPKGAYAVVTADPDTTFRLREMGQEIRDGRPIAGIMEELADMVGRLMPQIPRNVPENPEGTPKSPEQQEQRNM